MAAVPAAMLTRDPAALYREGTERQKGIHFGAGDREGERERKVIASFVCHQERTKHSDCKTRGKE